MAEPLLILVLLVGLAVWVWAIVDVVRRPTGEWESAGQNQVVWILVIVLLGPLGVVLYLAIARPRLADARR